MLSSYLEHKADQEALSLCVKSAPVVLSWLICYKIHQEYRCAEERTIWWEDPAPFFLTEEEVTCHRDSSICALFLYFCLILFHIVSVTCLFVTPGHPSVIHQVLSVSSAALNTCGLHSLPVSNDTSTAAPHYLFSVYMWWCFIHSVFFSIHLSPLWNYTLCFRAATIESIDSQLFS